MGLAEQAGLSELIADRVVFKSCKVVTACSSGSTR
jgi:hypothetical protein